MPFSINNWALQPFQQWRIRLPEKLEGLSDVPPTQIYIVSNGTFDHVSTIFQINCQIPLRTMDVNKSHIEIAIGRRETPRTAARFNGEQNDDFLFCLDRLQIGDDLRPDVMVCLAPPNGLTFSRKPRRNTFNRSVTVARGLAAATFCWTVSCEPRRTTFQVLCLRH